VTTQTPVEVPQLFESPSGCCGCTACVAVCPQQAIAMRPDDEGFDYPWIDDARCVGCMLCVRVCPMKNHGSPSPSTVESSDGGR